MPRKDSRKAPGVSTIWLDVHQEARTANPYRNTPWGSSSDNDSSPRILLGPDPYTSGKGRKIEMLGQQTVHSNANSETTARETTHRPYAWRRIIPIRYRKTTNRHEGKSYLVILSCSLSRAVHLELIHDLETTSFLPCLKQLIANRGRPKVINSDNGATFAKAANWLKQVRKDEHVQGLLQQHNITWKFNLSRAPWWGGQFERLVGVVKSALYKVIGGAILTLA